MCGRYTITTPGTKLAQYFDAALPTGPIPINTNARPTQRLPIILNSDPSQIVMAHWGYPIHIGKTEKELINIRAESIETKPFFKRASQQYRCIILADGFYEWKQEDGGKHPYRLTVDFRPIAFAGIYKWQQKKLSDELLSFFSIITVRANDFMRDIHDRMPVILERGHEKEWLSSPESSALLKPFAKSMKAERVTL